MSRRSIFNRAVRSAPAEPQPKYFQAYNYLTDLLNLFDQAEDAYAFMPDKTALPAMTSTFEKIIGLSVNAARDFGAVSRKTGEILGNDKAAAFKALDEERDYQESKVRATFDSAGKNFALTQELTMMRAYLRKECPFPARLPDSAILTTIRKIAAMALRGCENPSL